MEERHCNFCLMYSGNFSFSPYLSEKKEKKTTLLNYLVHMRVPKGTLYFSVILQLTGVSQKNYAKLFINLDT